MSLPKTSIGAILLLAACGTPRVESAYRLDAAGLTASESRRSQTGASCISAGPWRTIVVHLEKPAPDRVYEIGSPAMRILYGAQDAVESDGARGIVRVRRLEPERLLLAFDVEFLRKGRVVDRLREEIEFGFGRVVEENAPGLRPLVPAQ